MDVVVDAVVVVDVVKTVDFEGTNLAAVVEILPEEIVAPGPQHQPADSDSTESRVCCSQPLG